MVSEMLKELKALLDSLALRFTSGNDVPVTRATIKREEYELLISEFERIGKRNTNLEIRIQELLAQRKGEGVRTQRAVHQGIIAWQQYTLYQSGLVIGLGVDNLTQEGDLVMVGEEPNDGFRVFKGRLGVPVGEFGYPLFREAPGITMPKLID
jgi:hypothetical protein